MLNLTFQNDGHVTKNTHRFEEMDIAANKPKEKGEWVIGKIYIQKSHLPDHIPDKIAMLLEW